MFRHLMQDGLHITELRSPQAFCIGQNRIQAALLDIHLKTCIRFGYTYIIDTSTSQEANGFPVPCSLLCIPYFAIWLCDKVLGSGSDKLPESSLPLGC